MQTFLIDQQTHSGKGQRFLELAFHDMSHGTVDVSMPNSPNLAPPGFYMLLFMNNQD
ncbi:MAG: DUF1929 domain-containing protein [Oligoflexus sp.]|nr:DUF1929 domain-containing protein [Oligoflexus sp.]